jgi:hypothetical protein
MSTPHKQQPAPIENSTPSTETYFEALMKMPLNRLLYEVLFGSKQLRTS